MSKDSIPQRPYGIVYCFTNTTNGKQYIGQTIQRLDRRIKGHLASGAQRGCRAIRSALQKHGFDNFKVEVLASAVDQSELDRLESELIASKNTMVPHGYNLRGGGSHGRLSDETKKIKSEIAKSGNWVRHLLTPDGKRRFPAPMLSSGPRNRMAEAKRGQRLSPEHKEKIGAAHRSREFSDEHVTKLRQNLTKANAVKNGKPLCDEHKQKISQALRGRPISDARLAQLRETAANARASIRSYGRPHSVESKMKIAASLRGRKCPPEVIEKIKATKAKRKVQE
jgi:group I intron endonuclease